MFARVAVAVANYSLDKPYDYLIPEETEYNIKPGSRVLVPYGVGNRITEGIVLSLSDHSERPECKVLLCSVDQDPILTKHQLQLALFMREHYYCTVYEAARAMLPAGLWLDKTGKIRTKDKTIEMIRLNIDADEAMVVTEERRSHRAFKQAEVIDLLQGFENLPLIDVMRFTGASRPVVNKLLDAGIVALEKIEVYRQPDFGKIASQSLPVLNEEQEQALYAIRQEMDAGDYGVSLLSGVTGSGKTGIYAHLISECILRNQSAILMVPEIALTPQMMTLFKAWFGENVALLHSALSIGERYDEWKRIRRGEARIVLGTRSAVFAPIQSLGLIIIDEEQEDSYRSDSTPRYHAREIADCRCRQEHALLLLGSATPDLSSRYAADRKLYSFHQIFNRYNQKPMPTVQIVDMREELRTGHSGLISRPLQEALLKRLTAGEQSILFLNRRGTHKLVTCPNCGFIYICPHCSVAMTWHARPSRLICHYCGNSKPIEKTCPECGSSFVFRDPGTQKVTEELDSLFPDTSILRVDADSVSPLGSHRILFERFQNEKIPIMVGTQMVAKGLSFENVTLVGVLSADQGLYANDFRAGEKTFSLLTQVIGRCGRGDKAGEAVIQTFSPKNEIIRLAAAQDYESFYQKEISMRQIQKAPPFYDWIAFCASGKGEQSVIQSLHDGKNILCEMLAQENDYSLVGPLPMPIAKVNDRYRYRLQLCCRLNKGIRRILSTLLSRCIQSYGKQGITFYIENEF